MIVPTNFCIANSIKVDFSCDLITAKATHILYQEKVMVII
jgi:hypothetical protein